MKYISFYFEDGVWRSFEWSGSYSSLEGILISVAYSKTDLSYEELLVLSLEDLLELVGSLGYKIFMEGVGCY